MAGMTRDQRLNAILNVLTKNGKVQVSDLVKEFKVTDMTIRRDFDYLVSKGKITRIHGGAVLSSNTENSIDNFTLEPSYGTRIAANVSNKHQIAQQALQFVEPKQFVFLDSGTTTLNIAKSIPRNMDCTFITNAINVVMELLTHQHQHVIIVGGELELNTLSTRGCLAESQVNNFHADIAFLGCNAISPEGNVMIGNASETGIKQKIMEISNKIYLVADSSKFDSYSLITYASITDFDGIITDRDLSKASETKLLDLGGRFFFPGNISELN